MGKLVVVVFKMFRRIGYKISGDDLELLIHGW